MTITVSERTTKIKMLSGFRFAKLSSLKLKYRMFDTIKKARM